MQLQIGISSRILNGHDHHFQEVSSKKPSTRRHTQQLSQIRSKRTRRTMVMSLPEDPLKEVIHKETHTTSKSNNIKKNKKGNVIIKNQNTKIIQLRRPKTKSDKINMQHKENVTNKSQRKVTPLKKKRSEQAELLLQVEGSLCEVEALLDHYHKVKNAYRVTPMTRSSWRKLMA